MNPYRYDQLKLFFISLVWRAAISKHGFYGRIKIGPRYEDRAKRLIEFRDPGPIDDFTVNLAKFDDPVVGKAMLDPHLQRMEGINYCQFYFAGYIAYIKVDKRRAPPFLLPLAMAPDCPLKIVCRDLANSKELPLLRAIASAPQNVNAFSPKS